MLPHDSGRSFKLGWLFMSLEMSWSCRSTTSSTVLYGKDSYQIKGNIVQILLGTLTSFISGFGQHTTGSIPSNPQCDSRRNSIVFSEGLGFSFCRRLINGLHDRIFIQRPIF